MGGGGGGVDIKDSEDQKAMAQIAKEKWQLYQSKFVPQENAWMADVASWNDADKYDQAAGKANAGTNSAYGHAMQQLLSQGGNTGRINAGINDLALGMANTRNENTNRMQISQQDQYVAGLQNIAQVGLGKETQALSTMSDAANISNAYAQQQAASDASNSNSWSELAGMGIGAAIRGGM